MMFAAFATTSSGQFMLQIETTKLHGCANFKNKVIFPVASVPFLLLSLGQFEAGV
jgi:hypothetical protein